MNFLSHAGLVVALTLTTGVAAAAPTPGQSDTFDDGTTQGWTSGGDSVSAVADAGPGGVGDTATRIVSDGSGQTGRITAFNVDDRWTGDWTAAGIFQVRVSLNNAGAETLMVRLKLEDGPSKDDDYVVTDAQAVAADGAWHSYTFDVVASRLSGPADPVAALAGVTKLRIQHDTDGIHPPDLAAGTLLFDNVTALGDTCGNGLRGPGEACDGDDVGTADCAGLSGFDGGTLACDPSSACQVYDTSLCTNCGDGTCEAAGGETALSCPADCTACGDGVISGPEVCEPSDLAGQTCASVGDFDDGTLACAAGCGAYDTAGCTRCGDGACEGDETAAACPSDCTTCGDGAITGAEVCEPSDLAGASCASLGFDDGALDCAADCGGFDVSGCTRCGDGTCATGETLATCAADCTSCGDGVCAGVETPASCAADCPTICGDGVVSGDEACDWGGAGAFVDLFTSSAQLGGLGGFDVDAASGVIYLADPGRDAVHRIDALSGATLDATPFIQTLGGDALDVQVGPLGDLYVVSGANNRVEIYDPDTGNFFSAFPLGGGLLHPEAIDFRDEPRRVYVASGRDDGGQLQPIREMNLITGLMIGPFGEAVGENDLEFGPGGDLFTVQGAALVRFDGDDGGALGPWLDAAGELDEIRRFTFAPDGAVFLLGPSGDGPILVKYDSAGTLVGTFGQGQVGPGAGLALGLDGRLLGPGVDPSPSRAVALARFETGNSDTSADSCRTTCVAARCGDGTVDTGEECDDGDASDGDGCSACALDAGWVCDPSQHPNPCFDTCGDGALDPFEACDDGGHEDGDGCDASCQVEAGWACTDPSGDDPSRCAAAACGDGLIAGDEECEDLNTMPHDGCSSCTLDDGWVCDVSVSPNLCAETCGDGGPDEGEECDDGDTEDGDGCSANCVIELGWQCTPTTALSASFCVAAACGDGLAVDDEGCDDGNAEAGDGCTGCTIDDGWVCDVPLAATSTCFDTCGDGRPDDLESCDDGGTDDGDGCSSHCQIEAGWSCTTATSEAPSTCSAAACGDGYTVGTEECDDGDFQPNDGCTACMIDDGWVCRTAFVPATCFDTCGDGGPDPLEECDDGDQQDGDGCSANCVVEPGWACTSATLTTPSSCAAAACGDGVVTGGEVCDDGNGADNDGCSACVPDPGYVCDPGVQPSDCRPSCGDGALDALESCDDGDIADGDGCSANCTIEPGWTCEGAPSACRAAACGDLIIAGDEECEDGDSDPGDGCTACRVDDGWVCNPFSVPNPCAPTCGNGSKDNFEACDDGDVDDGDGCSANCAVEPGWSCGDGVCVAAACGDGVAVGAEECDDANASGADGCTACVIDDGWVCDLSLVPSTCADTCGDGLPDALEACDDGDTDDGDGCSANCAVEEGWSCTAASATEPSLCSAARCGDGLIRGDETCDDGNTEAGDGCGEGCRIEEGWSCDPGCVPLCGDGKRLGDEGCDDGNETDGDGCSGCVIDDGWSCSDDVGVQSVCAPVEICGDGERGASEACEDGNTDAGDGCSPSCEVEPDWSCDASGCTQDDDDEDGLSNIEERALGTAIDDADSDDDGLDDGAELTAGTLPLVADTDGDGLLDGYEVAEGYDPTSDNSDGDTLLDGVDNCPGVTNQDQRDADGDGLGDACDPTPGTRDPITLSGGEGCGGGAPGGGGVLWSLLAALALWLPRRATTKALTRPGRR